MHTTALNVTEPAAMPTRSMSPSILGFTGRRAAGALAVAWLFAGLAAGSITAPCAAQDQEGAAEETIDEAAEPIANDGPNYTIAYVELQYLKENPLAPPLENAMEVSVTLGKTPTGYVAPRPGVPEETITLAEWPVYNYYASALQEVLIALRDYYVGQDVLGVFAAADPNQITELGEDRRTVEPGLTIIITTGIIDEIRTVGVGDRVAEGGEIEPRDRINNEKHARILANSPFQPYVEGDADRSDLLRKSRLDRYLFHLGRHPGRRVDASLSAALDIGYLALDYQVHENRPLVLYAQVSNTGTPSTDYWRQRFGLFHTQLTNSDDVFSLDFTTASLDEVNALAASYERPFAHNDRIRWRVDATWSEYDANEVGFFGDSFEGESWSLGAGIRANIYQKREVFVDLLAGIRFEHHRVNNPFIPEGEEDFLFPYVGVGYDRVTEWSSTRATATLEWQSDLTDVDEIELSRLGRTAPDTDWLVLRWNASHSVYLEPLLDREAWADPTTPETSTLAHELLVLFRGQYAFDDRLIPQSQSVLGGLYTVRGYPQSVLAGDSSVIGTIEYRFHLPRAFGVEAEPGQLFGETFRRAPQYVYGVPDWDLILKGFLDVGRVVYSDNLFFENDETLIGAGVGVELLYRRNLNIRLDWGFTLDDLEAGQVNSGSNRLHVVATILF